MVKIKYIKFDKNGVRFFGFRISEIQNGTNPNANATATMVQV